MTNDPLRRLSIGLLLVLEACGRSTIGDGLADAGAADVLVPLDVATPEPSDATLDDGEPPEDAVLDAAAPNDCSVPTLAGTWRGTIDGFQSAWGSSSVTMSFAEASDGLWTGTVYFGTAPPPPPPTDPDVGYPTSAFTSSATTNVDQIFVDGFRHAAHSIAFDGVRLRFEIPTLDAWAAWCGLQTTTYFWSQLDGGPAVYGCLPNEGIASDANGACQMIDPTTGTSTAVNCGKVALCSGFNFTPVACRCSATSCMENVDADQGIAFDMRLACDRLDGSSSGQLQSLGVHLTRAQ